MVGGEPEALRMRSQEADPQRPRVLDEHAQHALTGRAWTDPFLLIRVEPDGDELGERSTFIVEDPECAVPRVGHRPGLVDDVTQQRGQLEISFEEQRGFQHPSQLGRVLDRVVRHAVLRRIGAARVQLQVAWSDTIAWPEYSGPWARCGGPPNRGAWCVKRPASDGAL